MTHRVEILDDRARFLAGRGQNFTSQFGEDGLVEALFERIGILNRWCFEVGAADGVYFSNTKRWRDQDWNAVLIEGDPDKYEALKLCGNGRVQTVNELIDPSSLDRILGVAGAPQDLDLGVIDIDGQDYWCWRGMRTFRPRVMLVEYSPYEQPTTMVALGGVGQAGIIPICALGEEKGYVALCHTYCNVLFCERGEWEKAASN